MNLLKAKTVIGIAIVSIFISFNSNAQDMMSQKFGNFDIDNDLLLAHYDCKTM